MPSSDLRPTRRTALKAGAAAAAAASTAAGKKDSTMRAFHEPARDVPIVEHSDVCVCGSGPAGVAAAIAAARAGAKTRLIEVNGCLGGVWTAGLLSWILDSSNKRGIMKEILGQLNKRGASRRVGGSVGYDVEQMKLLLEEMCVAAGVKIQLHTRVVAAARDAKNRLKLAITESKPGRQAWSAGVFIDATGDGDLAALAGCGFDVGRPGTGETQPTSMICLLTGIAPDGMTPFVRGLAEQAGMKNPKGRLLEEMRKAGVEPSYSQPTLFYIRDGLFCLMANHEYGVSATDAAQITEATVRSRAEVHRLINALRKLGGPWRDVLIVATAEHIGVREGRRIHGHYTVTTEDLAKGARHDDAVCRVRFGIDVHSTDPKKTKGIEVKPIKSQPYDIPYRALIAKDVDGLLLAGRCISGDFIAHSSYRVTGNAVAMGQAAGAAAALAASTGGLPQNVPWPELQNLLRGSARP